MAVLHRFKKFSNQVISNAVLDLRALTVAGPAEQVTTWFSGSFTGLLTWSLTPQSIAKPVDDASITNADFDPDMWFPIPGGVTFARFINIAGGTAHPISFNAARLNGVILGTLVWGFSGATPLNNPAMGTMDVRIVKLPIFSI